MVGRSRIADSETARVGTHPLSSILLSKLFFLLTQLVSLLLLVGSVYGVLGSSSLPGTEIFALFLLAASAYAGGVLVSCIKLPPLLGMLLVGILFRNTPFIPYHRNISVMWASTLREISLVIILLKAGLGLDPKKLMELKLDVFKLSFIPCLLEAFTSAVITHYLLGLPWLWAFMLGFILSAVSAAVLVPGMLVVEEKGLGIEKGIPTLLLAAVSIDNIVALTGFVITFSILTSNDSLTWTLIQRPIEPFIGFVLGALVGILFWYIPRENTAKRPLLYYRSLLLCLGGLSFEFMSKRLNMTGAGALGCVSLAFFASLKWRKDNEHFKNITWITGLLWSMIEPFLFGLIGAEVTIDILLNNIGMGILAIVLGISFRAFSTVLSLVRSKLNLKEKVFVSASWLSKATVQAAVGSQALDYARSHGMGSQFEEYSKQVLTMSVLSIVLTAPLGAAFIDHLAPRLLKWNTQVTTEASMDSSLEERESISEVTVTDYGAARRPTVGEIQGLIQGLKNPRQFREQS